MNYMKSIIATLRVFDAYLHEPEDSRTLRDHMEYYDKKLAVLNKDFQTIPINEDNDIQSVVSDILEHLGIHKRQRGRFLNAGMTAYDFLIELQEVTNKENNKLNEFIRLIDEKNKWMRKLLLIGGIVVGSVFSMLPAFFIGGGLSLVQTVLTASVTIPVAGLLYTAGVAAYTFYQSITNKRHGMMERFRDNFFLLANTALNVAAYSMVIATATSLNPVTAILFVVASCVLVLKEMTTLIQLGIQNRKSGLIAQDDDLKTRQEKTRSAYDVVKTRNALLIEFSGAILGVGIMAAWCFIPGGIFLTVAAVAAIGIVAIVKKLFSMLNEKVVTGRMKAEFDRLEQDDAVKEVHEEASKAASAAPEQQPDQPAVALTKEVDLIQEEPVCASASLEAESGDRPAVSPARVEPQVARPSQVGMYARRTASQGEDDVVPIQPQEDMVQAVG